MLCDPFSCYLASTTLNYHYFEFRDVRFLNYFWLIRSVYIEVWKNINGLVENNADWRKTKHYRTILTLSSPLLLTGEVCKSAISLSLFRSGNNKLVFFSFFFCLLAAFSCSLRVLRLLTCVENLCRRWNYGPSEFER